MLKHLIKLRHWQGRFVSGYANEIGYSKRAAHFVAAIFIALSGLGVFTMQAASAATALGEGDDGYTDTDGVAQSDIDASALSNTTSNIYNNNDGTDQTDNISCKKYTLNWIVNDSNGNPYDLNQDRYGNGNSCVTNSGGGANFTVTKGGNVTVTGNVMSYPNLIRGCSDSGCYQPNSWPKQVSSLSTWDEDGNIYTNSATGKWNASLDLWFNRSSHYGPSQGAEILIDLNRQNRTPPATFTRHLTNVTVSGASYDIYLWRQTVRQANGTTRTWNFLHFWRNSPVTSISGLNLTAFMTKAETINCSASGNIQCLQPSWYWTGSDTGFEIWSGGFNSAGNNGLTWGGVKVYAP